MKKFLLVFLSLYLLPIFAMEDEKLDINIAFRNAVMDANRNSSPEIFSEIKEYLELGADINYTMGILYREPAIIDAVRNLNKDLFNFLLQNNADINSRGDNEQTPLYLFIEKMHTYQLKPNIKKFDIEKDFLKRSADPNINADLGYPALIVAIKHKNVDLIKLLLKYGAKINEKDGFKWTPLRWAIDCRNFEVIKELCDREASLVDIDDNESNAFQAAIQRKLPKNYINLFITNSRFDSYNKKVDKQLEKKVITAYLALEKSVFHKDIQITILSHLALDYLYGFNKKFCNWLVKKAKDPLLAYTHRNVDCLEKILQSKNNQNKTALQILHEEYRGDWYIQEIESLVDVEKLRKDRTDFVNRLAREDNLVMQIYENAKKLLLDS